ncbi:MAG: SIR2 family protein [Acidobacteria bacterium]|nr:SIR2 family protein [Acidobacteriota bacterium]
MSNPPAGTWKDLVREIASTSGVTFDDGIPAARYPDLIDDCIAKDEAGCNQVLRRILPEHSSSSRTALHYIHSFNLKAVVTTNFDPYIRFQGSAEKYTHVHIYPDLPLSSGLSNGIFYIHGYFGADDVNANICRLVLGRRSFEQAYRDSLLPGFLLNLFVYEDIIFVGFNPTEHYVSQLLEQAMRMRAEVGSNKRRYILVRAPSGTASDRAWDENWVEQIKSLGIEPVYYDSSLPDYNGLEELLNTWLVQSNLKSRPAPLTPSFGMN